MEFGNSVSFGRLLLVFLKHLPAYAKTKPPTTRDGLTIRAPPLPRISCILSNPRVMEIPEPRRKSDGICQGAKTYFCA
jgi:hypothetical protein